MKAADTPAKRLARMRRDIDWLRDRINREWDAAERTRLRRRLAEREAGLEFMTRRGAAC